MKFLIKVVKHYCHSKLKITSVDYEHAHKGIPTASFSSGILKVALNIEQTKTK